MCGPASAASKIGYLTRQRRSTKDGENNNLKRGQFRQLPQSQVAWTGPLDLPE